jgi:hypothetical protein
LVAARAKSATAISNLALDETRSGIENARRFRGADARRTPQ